MENLSMLATIITLSGALSLLCLLVLHFVSPEFKPAWRMVSEYALGKHKWLITSFFVLWSISSVFTALFFFKIGSNNWTIMAAILVFISGIGALMGGIFDVRHKLHGLAFALGVPTFPIGALIMAYHLSAQNNWLPYKTELLISAHSVWISLVLMGMTMGMFFSSLKKAGIPFGPNEAPLDTIPKELKPLNGYMNRLLILVYVGFNLVVASIYLNM